MKLSCQYSHIIDTFEFLLLSRGGQERNLGLIVSPEQSFWCGWGHLCHGNKFFCGNILQPLTSAVFAQLS